MFKLIEPDGDIVFPDGFVLECPYDDPRYIEYAAWIQAGNEPEVIK